MSVAAGCALAVAVVAGSSCHNSSSSPTTPPASLSVSGVVNEASTNSPLSSATVTVQGRNAVTGGDGRYSIADVSAGQTTITVTHQGHDTVTQSVTVSGATTS